MKRQGGGNLNWIRKEGGEFEKCAELYQSKSVVLEMTSATLWGPKQDDPPDQGALSPCVCRGTRDAGRGYERTWRFSTCRVFSFFAQSARVFSAVGDLPLRAVS